MLTNYQIDDSMVGVALTPASGFGFGDGGVDNAIR
jgi:hypothetical protein